MQKIEKVLLVCTAVFAAALLYFFFDARYSALFPKCPFYSLTGLFCPGCGSQRAFSSVLHGSILQAAGYNLLMVLALPILLYSAGVSIINSLKERPVIQHLFYSPVFTKTVLVIILIFWLLRNIPVYPFTLLAPHSPLP